MHQRTLRHFTASTPAAASHLVLHVPSKTLPTQAAAVVPLGAAHVPPVTQLSDLQSLLMLQPLPSLHCLQLES